MEQFVERMYVERDELATKINKLSYTLENLEPLHIKLSPLEKYLMEDQLEAMDKYYRALNARISIYNEEKEDDDEDDYEPVSMDNILKEDKNKEQDEYESVLDYINSISQCAKDAKNETTKEENPFFSSCKCYKKEESACEIDEDEDDKPSNIITVHISGTNLEDVLNKLAAELLG